MTPYLEGFAIMRGMAGKSGKRQTFRTKSGFKAWLFPGLERLEVRALLSTTHLVIQTQPSSTATAGQTFGTQPVIYEENASNNLVTGDNSTVVTASIATGSGSLQGTVMVTLSGGIGTFTNLGNNTAGTITLKFTATGAGNVTSSNIVIGAAAASQLVMHVQPSSTATAGAVFGTQPVVYEEDQYNNLETGDSSTTVTAGLQSGTGPLKGTTTVTVAGGIATFVNLADNTAETIKLLFTSGSLTQVTSHNIAVSPAVASQLAIHTQPSGSATAGAAFNRQPVVYVEDQYGNIETGDSSTIVTAAIGSGTGPLQGTATETVSGGIATFTNLADNTAETITLSFSSNPVLTSPTSNNIVVSAAAASQLVIHTQPSSTATAGSSFATQPVIYEEDQYGNLETGDSSTTVTAALLTGTGPLGGSTTKTVSGGIATFTNLKDNTAETIALQFGSSNSLTSLASNNVVVSSAAASQLVIFAQPSSTATAGATFTTQPVVYEEDQFGNIETGDNSTSVTAATKPAGSGPLAGTTSVTVVNGVATFTDLANNTAGSITLHFSAPSLSGVDSSTILVSPAAATQLKIFTQPSPTAIAGVAFTTQPVVYEEDQFGNIETGDNSTTVTVASRPANSGPLQGTTTVTVSGGVATFTDLADDIAETITLRITSTV